MFAQSIGCVFLVLVGIWWILKYFEHQREILERERRIREFLDDEYDALVSAEAIFVDHGFGYFTNSQLVQWKNKYISLAQMFSKLNYSHLAINHPGRLTIEKVLKVWREADTKRLEYNEVFIQNELDVCSDMFDEIEGRKLDDQQRRAVVTDEDNTFVVAAAGSGKTTTLVGKVHYLMNRCEIPPEQILLISFTRKSAQTLAERLGIEEVQVLTFHKFGINVIEESTKKKLSLFEERQYSPLITRIFTDLCKNRDYVDELTCHFQDYLKPFMVRDEFRDQGE
jgi:DNA helicase-4